MEFTEEEMGIIRKAEFVAKRAKAIRIMGLFFLVVALLLMYVKMMSPESFAVVALVIVAYSAIEPHSRFASAPSYEDLVRLLLMKSSPQDPVMQLMSKLDKSRT